MKRQDMARTPIAAPAICAMMQRHRRYVYTPWWYMFRKQEKELELKKGLKEALRSEEHCQSGVCCYCRKCRVWENRATVRLLARLNLIVEVATGELPRVPHRCSLQCLCVVHGLEHCVGRNVTTCKAQSKRSLRRIARTLGKVSLEKQ